MPGDSCFGKIEEYEKNLHGEPGVSVEYFPLHDYCVRQCVGCNCCAFKTPGICIHEDDVMEILSRVLKSDRTVFYSFLQFTGALDSYTKEIMKKNGVLYEQSPAKPLEKAAAS